MAAIADLPLAVAVSEGDHAQGPATARVTLVEYGDYECPHCGAVHPIIKEIQRQMGDGLRFVFRNFPLASMHRHAMQAAEAAEAAGAQGKFWEMHDRLFDDQEKLETADLVSDATATGLDVKRFESDLGSHVYLPRVQEDYRGAIKSGVKGTPAFFINGARYKGAYDLDPLLGALRATRSSFGEG